jgi:hypothetical protein
MNFAQFGAWAHARFGGTRRAIEEDALAHELEHRSEVGDPVAAQTLALRAMLFHSGNTIIVQNATVALAKDTDDPYFHLDAEIARYFVGNGYSVCEGYYNLNFANENEVIGMTASFFYRDIKKGQLEASGELRITVAIEIK